MTVRIGDFTGTVTSLRDGYAHVELPLVLSPGWHELTLTVPGREPVTTLVKAVNPAAHFGVISDIDDTILVTWVPRPLLAAWNTFVLPEHARRSVDGMAELIRSLAAHDAPVVYLSTGSWNVASHLERFMSEHDFPPGPMLLTDWGPTETRWFRQGASHKREMLERLHREHPHIRWTLLGDDGQRDPEIYAEFVAAHPQAVRAVAIRHLSNRQRLVALAHPASELAGVTSPGMGPLSVDVVWVSGADGHEIAAALSVKGVLPTG